MSAQHSRQPVSRLLRRIAGLLLLVWTTSFLAGCNAGVIGIAVWLALEDDDGRRHALVGTGTSDAAVLFEGTENNRTQPDQTILIVRLVDAGMVPAQLRIERELADGSFVPITFTAPFAGTDEGDGVIGGLATSGGGVRHLIGWNAVADLGGTQFQNVTLRLTPSGEDPQSVIVTVGVGNDPPSIEDLQFVQLDDGSVTIQVTLADSAEDPVDLDVRVSTEIDAPVDDDFGAITTEFPTTTLASSIDGRQNDVLWLVVTDLGAADRDVRVRLVPRDLVGAATEGVGDTVERALFIDANRPPTVQMVRVGGRPEPARRRGVGVTFDLLDPESNDSDVIVQWAFEGDTIPDLPPELDDPAARDLLLASPDERRALRIATLRPDPLSGAVEMPLEPDALGADEVLATWIRHTAQLRGLGELRGKRVTLETNEGIVERVICGYSARRGVLTVAEPFDPPATPGDRLTIDLGGVQRLRADPYGVRHTVLWATDVDAPGGGDVVMWITPFDRVIVDPADDGAGCADGFPFPTQNALAGGRGAPRDAVDEFELSGPFGERGVQVLPLAPVDQPRAVDVGDLDGDGNLDIAVASRGARSLMLFFQHVPGSFDVLRLLDARIGEPTDVIIEDLDGDGDLDVAVSSEAFTTDAVPEEEVPAFNYPGSVLLYLQAEGNDFIADRVSVTTGDDLMLPSAVVAGDLDGDGDADLVASDAADDGSALTLFFREGGPSSGGCAELDSGYSACTLDRAGAISGGTRDVALADVDGDGRDDLVTGYQGGLTVFWQDGAGEFGAASTEVVMADADLASVEVIDVDGDMRLDLVVADTAGRSVVVVRQADARLFEVLDPLLPISEARADLEVADLDGNGADDLVIADPGGESGVVTVCLSDGALGFSCDSLGRMTDGVNMPAGIAAGDVDGDGLLDVVSADDGSLEVAIFLQAQPATFPNLGTVIAALPAGSHPSSIAPADFDGDGDLDLAVVGPMSGEATLLLQETSGVFAAQSIDLFGGTESAGPAAIVAGDIDGDGRADLATANMISDDVLVALQDEDGRFRARRTVLAVADEGAMRNPQTVALADVDGDGRVDVLAAGRFSQDVLWFRQIDPGEGTVAAFADPVPLPLETGTGPLAIRTGDLDGDGRVDVVAGAHSSGGVAVWLQNETRGEFSVVPVTFADNAYPTDIELADYDGDGDLDIAAANLELRSLVVLSQTTGADFDIVEVDELTWRASTGLASADIDLDGRPDLVMSAAEPGALHVVLSGGDDGFLEPQTLERNDVDSDAAIFLPVAVEAFDLDGDGEKDLVTVNRFSNDVTVFWGRR